MIILLSGGSGKLNLRCVAAVLMSLITTNDRINYHRRSLVRSQLVRLKKLFVLHCPHKLLCYTILMYLYLSIGCNQYHLYTQDTSITYTGLMTTLYFRAGRIIVGGKVVTGGSSDVAALLAFWISNSSMTTSAAIASTMGTARGTTQGSCRPRATSVPGVPSYWAVSCDCEMVAGDLKPILIKIEPSDAGPCKMDFLFYRK